MEEATENPSRREKALKLPLYVQSVCQLIREEGDVGMEWSQCALFQKSDSCIPRMKLHGLVPNSYIHVYVNDLHIPRIAHRYRNVEIGKQTL